MNRSPPTSIDAQDFEGYHPLEVNRVTGRERRTALFEAVSKARDLDRDVFVRASSTVSAVSREVYRSSVIEGCNVTLEAVEREVGALVAERSAADQPD